MKELLRLPNKILIFLVLTVFYFPVLGIAVLIIKLTRKSKQEDRNTYWISAEKAKFTKDYFLSPY